LLWITPFRLAFRDIRFALIVSNWISAWAFFRWSQSRENTDSLVPILSSLAWLSFPVTNFIIEQSWTDLALIPPVLLAFHAIRSRRTIASGVWLGIFLAVKQ